MKKRTAGIRIALAAYFLVLAVIVFLADGQATRYLLAFAGEIPYGDKLGHFFLMGFLAFLANLAFESRVWTVWLFRITSVSIFVATIVTIEEISQIFVSGRSFDFTDLISDFLGIVIFGEFARWIREAKRRESG